MLKIACLRFSNQPFCTHMKSIGLLCTPCSMFLEDFPHLCILLGGSVRILLSIDLLEGFEGICNRSHTADQEDYWTC